MSDSPALIYAIGLDRHCHDRLDRHLQPDYRLRAWDAWPALNAALQAQLPALLVVDLESDPAEAQRRVNRFAAQHKHLPVVLVSANGISPELTDALQSGGWDYLLKPVENTNLVRLVIERALERARLRQQAEDYRSGLEQTVVRRIEALRQANQELQLAAIAFETHDAITITDRNGKILRVNEATERMTGYRQEELVGQSPRIWQSGLQSGLFFQRLRVRLQTDGCWQGVLWTRTRHNQLFPVWQSISAVTDDAGQVRYYVGIATDLSELKAKERVLAYRAREERVLGGLASLALEQSERSGFLQAALALLQTHLDELCLLDRIQIWQWDGADFHCEAYGACAAEVEVPRPHLHAALRDGRFQQLHLGPDPDDDCPPTQCLLIPLRSTRRDIGVLVLYSDADAGRPLAAEFFHRLGEVLSLSLFHQQTERELHHQANHDHLTGLPNRQLMTQLLQQQLKTAQRRRLRGAVLFIDLDNFKTLNDSLGHSLGDELLRQLGMRVRRALREEDILSRLGGDEFVVVVPPVACEPAVAEAMANQVAQKVLDVIHQPFQLGEHEYLLGASIGAVTYPEGGTTVDDLLKHADSAMYRAKAAGRNSVRFFLPELQQAADQRLDLERKLRRALERDELSLHYQPQFDARLEVVGAEVLLRWRRDEDGWIAPADFIPIAEDSGLILPIGNWVFDQVCAQLARWDREGVMTGCSLSINISPNQFYQPGFVEQLLAALRRHEVVPSRIVLEITEGVVLRNVDEAISLMKVLKRAGVRFALDDFGTGYSSLSYLKRLPVDELKIDRSFVLAVDSDPDDAMIVDAILSLAGHFGLKVVAEGVETAAALLKLQQRGCALFQGFYFSRPLAPDQLEQFLAGRESSSA